MPQGMPTLWGHTAWVANCGITYGYTNSSLTYTPLHESMRPPDSMRAGEASM